MATLLQVVRYLNAYLKVNDVPDYSRNGLQVRTGGNIETVGLAVDACVETAIKASKNGCDLLLVHHGLFWKGKRDTTGVRAKRVAEFKRNNVSLYAAHLPLDLHAEVGNNICITRALEADRIRKFGKYHSQKIGYMGEYERPIGYGSFKKRLEDVLGEKTICLRHAGGRIKSFGVVSGGGSKSIGEAYKLGLNALVTGEAPHSIAVDARDMGLNVFLGGHYATETFGVKALGKKLRQKFGVKTKFIENKTVI